MKKRSYVHHSLYTLLFALYTIFFLAVSCTSKTYHGGPFMYSGFVRDTNNVILTDTATMVTIIITEEVDGEEIPVYTQLSHTYIRPSGIYTLEVGSGTGAGDVDEYENIKWGRSLFRITAITDCDTAKYLLMDEPDHIRVVNPELDELLAAEEAAEAEEWERQFLPQTDNGALYGYFSVAPDRKIRFSQGNLQYQPSTATWRFALHQYDCIGDENSNISADYDGWIDLFGWGTSGYNESKPYLTDTDNASAMIFLPIFII